MLAEDHYNSQSIQKKTREVRQRWTELQRKMAERGDKLRQAGQQEQLMELLQVLYKLILEMYKQNKFLSFLNLFFWVIKLNRLKLVIYTEKNALISIF